MKLEATVGPATSLGEGVWITQVAPESLRKLADEAVFTGDTSVVLLPGSSVPPIDAKELVFEPSLARILTIGRTSRALFVYDMPNVAEAKEADPNERFGPRVYSDDDKLQREVESLPPHLAITARELITAVRSVHDGRFERTSNGKYVYRPNFWTVRVQPRDQSLAVTVYGRGPSLGPHPSLIVLPDQNSYSRFKIASRDQLKDALDVIMRAATLKSR